MLHKRDDTGCGPERSAAGKSIGPFNACEEANLACASAADGAARPKWQPAMDGTWVSQWRRRRRLLEHDPEKWIPVYGKRSCSEKKLERDDDSKKTRHALMAYVRGRRHCIASTAKLAGGAPACWRCHMV
jgi:hypothetical protein